MCHMRLLRTSRSQWVLATSLLLAASLLLAGAGVRAADPAAAPGRAAAAASGATPLTHGRFGDFPVYRPAGTPTGFVLFLSGDDGWSATADTKARQLVQQGAMVGGMDWPKFKANLE